MMKKVEDMTSTFPFNDVLIVDSRGEVDLIAAVACHAQPPAKYEV